MGYHSETGRRVEMLIDPGSTEDPDNMVSWTIIAWRPNQYEFSRQQNNNKCIF